MKAWTPLLLLLVAGCQLSTNPPGGSCAANKPAFSRGKVELFNLPTSAMSSSFGLLPSDSGFQVRTPLVPSGHTLMAVVNEACLFSTPRENRELSTQLSAGQTLGRSSRTYPWTLTRAMKLEEISRIAERDECLVGLGDEVIQTTSSSDLDPLISSQAHLRYIGALESIENFYGLKEEISGDLTVAIIDTGVDMTQEDLITNYWRNHKEIPDNQLDDDHNGYVDDVWGYNFATNQPTPQYNPKNPRGPHGTHVAGLAAARLGNSRGGTGVMGQHAKIMALNVFGASPDVSSSVTDNAIRYAADQGADVINLSVGGAGPASSQRAAIEYAISKGAVVVAAAGNENASLDQYFVAPASYASQVAGLIAVGSVDVATNLRSRFSNFSPRHVQIAAPGAIDSRKVIGLLSTMPGNSYGRLQGTSMATPIVSGAALLAKALLKRRGMNASPGQIEAWLTHTAHSIKGLEDQFQGGRVLSVSNLMQQIAETAGPQLGLMPLSNAPCQ